MSFGILPQAPGVQYLAGDAVGGPPVGSTITNAVIFPFGGGRSYAVGQLIEYKNSLYLNIAPTTTVVDAWDAVFGAPQVTVSSDGLTATSAVSNGIDTIRDNNPHINGKFYCEFSTVSGSVDLRYGFGQAAGITNTTPPGATTAIAVVYRHFGEQWLSPGGTSLTGMPVPSPGAIIGLAFDITTANIWVCNASAAPATFYGNNGVGDPVAETNPRLGNVVFSGVNTYAMFSSNQNGAAQPCTVNFGATPFVGVPPAGYLAWGANLTPDLDTAHWANIHTFSGTLILPGGTVPILTTSALLANGAAAAAGTLLNAPVAGNPTKWIAIDDGGVTRQVPVW